MITILTDFRSPRLEYVVDTIFKKWLELDYTIVTIPQEVDANSICLAYGVVSPKRSISLFSEGLLAESNLRTKLPALSLAENSPVIFPTDNELDYDLPFDIFSAVFFCLTRYEEYLTTQRDKHARFKAEDSIFHDYHRIPYLDRWVLELESLIDQKLPNRQKRRSFSWLSTMDMDVAFAYKGRSCVRNIGATGKDLLNRRFDRLRERADVLLGHSADPFDTYDLFLEETESDSKRLFIPVGNRNTYDFNLDPENALMRRHILELQKRVKIGLHPSYESLGKEAIIENEKKVLEQVCGEEISESRQHFLRVSIPETYRSLEKIGIKKDYTMGFHDEVGFRSGTAYCHHFYDLKNEVKLSLELVPLIAMDSAMKNYLKLSAEESTEVMKELLIHMKKTGGVFTTVWHNHSLSEKDDWKGWRSVFMSLTDMVHSHR